jgi:hypothetical protein
MGFRSKNTAKEGSVMAPRFYPLTLEEFTDLLERFNFTRKIVSVHMHHTWRPNHSQYQGEKSIISMWRYHTQENKWSDIAQHISIAPDGTIWTGRNWNNLPVSATGHNGNSMSGPFMFETIGDFDQGNDCLEGNQRAAVLGVIARVQLHFGLAPESLRFHNAMTTMKTCPGTSLVYGEFLDDVRKTRESLAEKGRAMKRTGKRAVAGSNNIRVVTDGIIRMWEGSAARGTDPMDAEPDETDMTTSQVRRFIGLETLTLPAPGTAQRAVARGEEITPDILDELRPHVINLTQGKFSAGGIFQTSRSDVDVIFESHLEQALTKAKENGQPLRLLFWAHGGLISEEDGLRIAHLQVGWWKRNNIYPIHFVWETGFFDALKQIFSGMRQAVPRDLWDYTSDPAIEALARALGGVKIWSAMKRSAELAVADDGGASYVAEKLAVFCAAHVGEVELHAAGHSAGSIFHSHFLPTAFAKGVPSFKSLHFLAPAIRADEFKRRLLPTIGNKVEHLAMFTMKRDWEEDDDVAKIYRKSLLYLIYYALEPESKTPILGLEISVRENDELKEIFGLRGTPSRNAEVVWSVSQETTGRNASTSRSHGGFDNDRPTMNSVARRVLDNDNIVDFPDEAVERAVYRWDAPVPLPADFRPLFSATGQPEKLPPVSPPSVPAAAMKGSAAPAIEGKKSALCIGIDNYPTAPLSGCVADARQWASTLEGLGFATSLLLNENATRSAILDNLRSLVVSSAPGDVVVFQFAGHGTELDDLNGDETGGSNGDKDESLCPYDIAQGAFVIDDDISEIFAGIPEGVNVTCFIDCCHSGTITRILAGNNTSPADTSLRARFLPATPEIQAAHRDFRSKLASRALPSGRTPDQMKEVLFSACLDSEVAYESNGHGEFTLRATQILGGGVTDMTNEEFQKNVTAAFGSSPRQHPDLDCATTSLSRGILSSFAGVEGRGLRAPEIVYGEREKLAQAFRTIADILGRAV